MGKINTWLEKKLAVGALGNPRPLPATLPVIVEIEPGASSAQVATLLRRQGLRVEAVLPTFIKLRAPVDALDRLAELEGVRRVSYDAPVSLGSAPFHFDPLLGRIQLPAVEVPYSPSEMALSMNLLTTPIQLLASLATLRVPRVQKADVIIIPTGDLAPLMGVPEGDRNISTVVAVLDTGLTVPHPLIQPSKGLVQLYSTTGEFPWDGLGHGTHVTTTAFGDSFPTRFGLCRGVSNPTGGKLISIKCLSNVGFGATFSILKALDLARDRGARVVNMSLGSELQGSVDEDPLCRAIELLKDEMIVVVAAGNSGPGDWTIGSPGASPFALTVGAWSPYYRGLAIFSSRGPSGAYYKDHHDTFISDYNVYGDNLVKPDCLAPGGGPVKEGDPMDLSYSGVTGWTDGMYDLLVDGFEGMRGTSMASPMAAGLIAWAYDRGLVRTAADVKRKLAISPDPMGGSNGANAVAKSPQTGYGFITLGRLT